MKNARNPPGQCLAAGNAAEAGVPVDPAVLDAGRAEEDEVVRAKELLAREPRRGPAAADAQAAVETLVQELLCGLIQRHVLFLCVRC